MIAASTIDRLRRQIWSGDREAIDAYTDALLETLTIGSLVQCDDGWTRHADRPENSIRRFTFFRLAVIVGLSRDTGKFRACKWNNARRAWYQPKLIRACAISDHFVYVGERVDDTHYTHRQVPATTLAMLTPIINVDYLPAHHRRVATRALQNIRDEGGHVRYTGGAHYIDPSRLGVTHIAPDLTSYWNRRNDPTS